MHTSFEKFWAIFMGFLCNRGFPGDSDGKSVCLQYWRPKFDPKVRKIPWRRKWQPTPVLLPGKFHGWRSLVGYSPRGQSQTQLSSFTFSFFYIIEKLKISKNRHSIRGKRRNTVKKIREWWSTIWDKIYQYLLKQ